MQQPNQDRTQRVTGIAMKSAEGRGVLPAYAVERFEQLRMALAQQYRATQTDEDRRRIEEWAGCLDRLDTVLLQVARLANTATGLGRLEVPGAGRMELPPGAALSLRATETCADFESLLFHSRAALDRLSVCVARKHKQKNVLFSELATVLSQASKSDPRPVIVLELLAKANVQGILTDLLSEDGKRVTALRSRVAHYTSVAEGTRIVFMIHRLVDSRYLVFDCEALGYPVLKTSRILAQSVPFIILNTLAVYLGIAEVLDPKSFEPTWETRTVVFSEFLDPTEKGPLLAAVQMHPDGLIYKTQHINGSDKIRRQSRRKS